ncbi:5-oxoprolinase subunit PxpA [Motilimonas pumila]|uniref:5-oxoprolinase subunit PxpA n=1 Tax=Motilimonas pumila TaxID=2303987 RepID=A0A418YCF5_9GAMM|nr:5-oxoprolinase subunit PxpA [Motilimonas pumila]RJG42142.1 5-oxoprolinase subunit PxpA [Motilimonas pumila]
MKLNCDMGESYGQWQMGNDEKVMPHVHQANIACGFHASDPEHMANTIRLAKTHHVSIGAHPGYPDLLGFGRRSMKLSAAELTHYLHYQISALQGMCQLQGGTLEYVKPHGALYLDMMQDEAILTTVMQAVAAFTPALPLMIQASSQHEHHQALAQTSGLTLLFEAFADRRYQDNGQLTPRSQAGAVLSAEQMLCQAQLLASEGIITTESGHALTFPVDSLCVHGDNPATVAVIAKLKLLLSNTHWPR